MKIQRFISLPILIFALFLGSSGFSAHAHAAGINQAPACYSFAKNIRYGQHDSAGTADVDSLQHFLVNNGYFPSTDLGTGYFGRRTLIAVKKFQIENHLPGTGFVGQLTRAAIIKMQPGCGTAAGAATLYSISPESGPIGNTISIRGFGFSNSNTILIDGMVAANNVPIASSVAIACTTDPSCHGGINQTIIFKLPAYVTPDCPIGSMCPMYVRELTYGKVTITVRNNSAISNSLPFTITQ